MPSAAEEYLYRICRAMGAMEGRREQGIPTVQRQAIDISIAGNNTLLIASPERIRVLGMLLICEGDVSIYFQDEASGNRLTGVMSLAVDGNGFVMPMSMVGMPWLETGVNSALIMNLSAAVRVAGVLVYYRG